MVFLFYYLFPEAKFREFRPSLLIPGLEISNNPGCESEWTPGAGDGQGGLVCCDSWGHNELDTTERLNWTTLDPPLPVLHFILLTGDNNFNCSHPRSHQNETLLSKLWKILSLKYVWSQLFWIKDHISEYTNQIKLYKITFTLISSPPIYMCVCV